MMYNTVLVTYLVAVNVLSLYGDGEKKPWKSAFFLLLAIIFKLVVGSLLHFEKKKKNPALAKMNGHLKEIISEKVRD